MVSFRVAGYAALLAGRGRLPAGAAVPIGDAVRGGLVIGCCDRPDRGDAVLPATALPGNRLTAAWGCFLGLRRLRFAACQRARRRITRAAARPTWHIRSLVRG